MPAGQEAEGGGVVPEGESLRVFLLTAGGGEAVWEQFGHNAIWIHDTRGDWSAAFNWGVFDFQQVDFIPRLIRGTMLYSMRPANPDSFLAAYQREDRRTWIQELALTPEQKVELRAFVQWNDLPENRDYRYDYYRDNCSTRVRDALDRVLGGQLRARFDTIPTPTTYRWHTRRLLGGLPIYYLGIQLVLGPRADRPLSAWEEMFLPLRLRDWIREMEVADGEGGTRSLVTEERLLFDGTRAAEPSGPPGALPWFLLAGVLWGGLLVLMARGGAPAGLLGRTGLSLLGGGWAALAGTCGVLLMGAWLFTDHFFWYRNYNLLQLNPLGLILAVGFFLFLLRGRLPAWMGRLALILAGLSVVGALVQLIPGLGQRNVEVLLLSLPVNLGLGVAALALKDRPESDGDRSE
jgi:hypothetical protein